MSEFDRESKGGRSGGKGAGVQHHDLAASRQDRVEEHEPENGIDPCVAYRARQGVRYGAHAG